MKVGVFPSFSSGGGAVAAADEMAKFEVPRKVKVVDDQWLPDGENRQPLHRCGVERREVSCGSLFHVVLIGNLRCRLQVTRPW